MDYHYYEEAPEQDYLDLDMADELGAHGYPYGYQSDDRLALHPGPEEDYLQEQDGSISLMDHVAHSLENCVEPSLKQALSYLAPMLVICLLNRLLRQLYAGRRKTVALDESNTLDVAPLHSINLMCGCALLYISCDNGRGLLLMLHGISYALLQLVRVGQKQKMAHLIAVLIVGSQFLYELIIWTERSDWTQLRGLQMVANMKVISLAYDLALDPKEKGGGEVITMPGPLAFAGYLYSPATCVLGPWLSYGRYVECLVCPSITWLSSLRELVPNLLICLLTLIISNCWASALGELNSNSHLMLMYTGALSVRTSHYFVCYLAQSLMACSGQKLDNAKSVISRPWAIEWPRSIASLVRSWHIPMHEWLKRYIYGPRKIKPRCSTLVAVFCSYLVSSLMHGMDLRIYLVLLSLPIFGEGEVMLRRHLAQLGDACITANPCKGKGVCVYTRCPQKLAWRSISYWLVQFINLCFTLLVIFHLAYLGVVLMNDTLNTDRQQESSFLWHWSEAGYLSHYIGIGTFAVYLFIT